MAVYGLHLLIFNVVSVCPCGCACFILISPLLCPVSQAARGTCRLNEGLRRRLQFVTMAGRGHPATLPLLFLFLVLVGSLPEVEGFSYLSGYRLRSRLQRDRHMRNVRPNIILILTDDQDIELGKRDNPI